MEKSWYLEDVEYASNVGGEAIACFKHDSRLEMVSLDFIQGEWLGSLIVRSKIKPKSR